MSRVLCRNYATLQQSSVRIDGKEKTRTIPAREEEGECGDGVKCSCLVGLGGAGLKGACTEI